MKTASGKRDLVGAGQKSGQYWALDANTGQVVWVTETGPGGTAGGLQWGSAVDGNRIYTANANSNNKTWSSCRTASRAASRPTRASVRSMRPPARSCGRGPPNGGGASGPATTANGVVYGCALDPVGHMVAMNAASGSILWDFASGGSCLSGGAISQGTVYWGSGYSNFGFGTPNKLYAFSPTDPELGRGSGQAAGGLSRAPALALCTSPARPSKPTLGARAPGFRLRRNG